MSGIERMPVEVLIGDHARESFGGVGTPLVLVRVDQLERLEWLLEQAREALAWLGPDPGSLPDVLSDEDIARARAHCGRLWDALPNQLLTQDETEEVWDRQLVARALRFTASDEVPGGSAVEEFDLADRVAMVTMADNLEAGR